MSRSRMREIRTSRGITLRHLALSSGIPYRTLQFWEGGGFPEETLRRLLKLSEILGCEMSELVEWDEGDAR